MAALPVQSHERVLPTGLKAQTIKDCSDAQIAELERRMRPGQYAASGFLSNEESLRAVCERDWKTLSSRGISCNQVGDILAEIIEIANKAVQPSNYHSVQITTKLQGKTQIFQVDGAGLKSNGYQPCPFGDQMGSCFAGRGDYTITNLGTQKFIEVSGLAIHLIQMHGFFEGDVSYRVDPEKVCDTLEITVGQYKRTVEDIWKFTSCSTIPEVDLEKLQKYAKLTQMLSAASTAYLVPFKDCDISVDSSIENSNFFKELMLKPIIRPSKGMKIHDDSSPTDNPSELYCHVVTKGSDNPIDTVFAERNLQFKPGQDAVYVFEMDTKTRAIFSDHDEKSSK